MRVLHTADVHLSADRPETIAGLEAVLEEATRHEVELLTIGGDLFDTPADAEALRPELRTLFRDNPFDIVAIPGNHDAAVYRENLRFGADLEVLVDAPLATRRFDDVELIGVPFTSSMTPELYAALEDASRPDRTQLLLLHCTLDIGFHASDVGADEGTYFPVTTATLAGFDVEYVLAGHIHAEAREVPLAHGGRFVYPGSPVSHTSSETGRRHAILLDTEASSIRSIPLETFYVDEYTATIRPGEVDRVLAEIEAWVEDRREDTCELSIVVDGFVDRDEHAFFEELTRAAGPVSPDDRTRSVEHVLDHPLYRRFQDVLDERAAGPEQEQAAMLVIGTLAELLAERKVQPA